MRCATGFPKLKGNCINSIFLLTPSQEAFKTCRWTLQPSKSRHEIHRSCGTEEQSRGLLTVPRLTGTFLRAYPALSSSHLQSTGLGRSLLPLPGTWWPSGCASFPCRQNYSQIYNETPFPPAYVPKPPSTHSFRPPTSKKKKASQVSQCVLYVSALLLCGLVLLLTSTACVFSLFR